ncbi:MAG TPA: phage holin family protein [Candidatus Krumholzibacteria bacterium]|nr:phage holin family protein [Candidatus Krumholzibacteria bacterium]
MDDSPHSESHGVFHSLRLLVDRVIAVVHNRTELLTTELREETARLVGVVLWAFIGVFAGLVGLTFAGFAIVLFIPMQYRAWVATGITALFFGVALFAYFSVKKIRGAKPRPFDATLREFEKDREHLRRTP